MKGLTQKISGNSSLFFKMKAIMIMALSLFVYSHIRVLKGILKGVTGPTTSGKHGQISEYDEPLTISKQTNIIPTPPWPRKPRDKFDLEKAIISAMKSLKTSELSSGSDAVSTIITAYYDIRHLHSSVPEGFRKSTKKLDPKKNAVHDLFKYQSHEKWLKNWEKLLARPEPMVIFVQPKGEIFGKKYNVAMKKGPNFRINYDAKEWTLKNKKFDNAADYVRSIRGSKPTVIVEWPIASFATSGAFAETFWAEQREFDLFTTENGSLPHENPKEIYKVRNEIMVFFRAAATLNPFSTPYFTWVNADYYENNRESPVAEKTSEKETLIVNDIGSKGVKKSAVLIESSGTKNNTTQPELDCMSISGSSEAVQIFVHRYFLSFWNMAKNEQFIGSSCPIVEETCLNFPDSCHVVSKRFESSKHGFLSSVADTSIDFSSQHEPDEKSSTPLKYSFPPKDIIIFTSYQNDL